MIRVKRALVSMHDKTGLAEFGTALSELGVELISTGGTAAKRCRSCGSAKLGAGGVPSSSSE